MTRRDLLRLPAASALAQSPARPNVVLMLIDDLGWKDVAFNGGELATPNIDRIAADGVRFTQYTTYPLCTPSRAGLLTGRSPMRHGLMYSVIRPWSTYGVPPGERMASEMFQQAGYQTAIIGKWHLGHAHRALLPNRRGFDHFLGHVNAEIDYFEHTKLNGLDWQRNGKGVREPGYATELLGNEAVQWLDQRDKTKPFFLYLPFNAIHSPMQAPAAALERFRDIADPKRRVLAAMLHVLDTQIGRVLDAIDRQNAAKNTLVVFLSDNGGAPGQGSVNRPYRAGKLTVYEGGLRVPAAMRWPGVLPAGSTVNEWITVLDMFPTLASAAGLTPGAKQPLDGVDMWSTIRGGRATPHPEFFAACKRNETADFQYALRTDAWKLVQIVNPRMEVKTELYDLARDPRETTDLSSQAGAEMARLTRELERWKGLHPQADYHSSMGPHPGWTPPADYAQMAAGYDVAGK